MCRKHCAWWSLMVLFAWSVASPAAAVSLPESVQRWLPPASTLSTGQPTPAPAAAKTTAASAAAVSVLKNSSTAATPVNRAATAAVVTPLSCPTCGGGARLISSSPYLLAAYKSAGIGGSWMPNDQSGISGYAFMDSNRNGTRDATEWVIGGAKVTLVDQINGTTRTAYTDGAGFYKFTRLADSTYSLSEVTPGGFVGGPSYAGGFQTLAGSVVSAPLPAGLSKGTAQPAAGSLNRITDIGLVQGYRSVNNNFSTKGLLPKYASRWLSKYPGGSTLWVTPADNKHMIAADAGYDDLTSMGNAYAVDVRAKKSYAGIYSTVTQGPATILGSTAKLLEGVNSSCYTTKVVMNWRTRAEIEATGQHPLLPVGAAYLASDVLNLSGVQGNFVLQMNYSPEVESEYDQWFDTRVANGGKGNLYLGWLDLSNPANPLWKNAVDGNLGTKGKYAQTNVLMTYQQFRNANKKRSLADLLGSWGVDINTDTVWAVVNHNGEFAVVPEPATLVLLGTGGLTLAGALLARRRRQKREDRQ